jgi:hypothetical protein
MKRLVLTFLLAFGWAAPAYADDPYSPFTVIPGAALHGGDYLQCWMCDFVKVRNIQGGDMTNPPESLNLDIGAGSTENPGTVTFQWDVGDSTRIYDGTKGILLDADDPGVDIYRRLRVCTDICREVATVDPPPPPRPLISIRHIRRVDRLERRVRRLRLAVRELLRRGR